VLHYTSQYSTAQNSDVVLVTKTLASMHLKDKNSLGLGLNVLGGMMLEWISVRKRYSGQITSGFNL